MASKKPGLIPQQRVDKNGRVVTRHVKPSWNSMKQDKIPKPDLNLRKDEAKAVADEILSKLENVPSISVADSYIHQALNAKNNYDLELLHFLNKALDQFSDKSYNADDLAFYHKIASRRDGDTEDYLTDHRVAIAYPVIREMGEWCRKRRDEVMKISSYSEFRDRHMMRVLNFLMDDFSREPLIRHCIARDIGVVEEMKAYQPVYESTHGSLAEGTL